MNDKGYTGTGFDEMIQHQKEPSEVEQAVDKILNIIFDLPEYLAGQVIRDTYLRVHERLNEVIKEKEGKLSYAIKTRDGFIKDVGIKNMLNQD